MTRDLKTIAACLGLILLGGCGEQATPEPAPAAPRTSILLVTLDTTRADSIGPDAQGVETPAFNALAAKGRRFTQAYATVPETLPSHTSIMTGLYPGGHGIHENARYVPDSVPLLGQQLEARGYTTAAFVSGYPLSRQFGLARGFEHFDDDLGGAERRAAETTDRALAWMESTPSDQPLFVWVHYFDPHYPYEPPAAWAANAATPYLDEIAAMDEQLGRLVKAFESRAAAPVAVAVVADHGEGLGEHGEEQHGNLLYQSTMHVPLVIAGPGVTTGIESSPVSIRRLYHTIRTWSGEDDPLSLTTSAGEVVMGEAMKPYLNFGWQPQVMAVEGEIKAIHDGKLQVFDLTSDPGESKNLAAEGRLPREARRVLFEYPVPSLDVAERTASISDEDRRQLASLGYISSESRPVIRADAPRPAAMTELFGVLDRASGLFAAGDYKAAIPLLETILERDPFNLMSALRLAAAHSALGNHDRALEAFERARQIAPESTDVEHYLALHHLRTGDWSKAAPLLERVVAESPGRIPAVAGLAEARMRQGRSEESLALWKRVEASRPLDGTELEMKGRAAMELGRTAEAIASFEALRDLGDEAFDHDLELGVLYLDARRLEDARRSLDRVPRAHPAWPMALFKRAQVSVLLREADSAAHIARAREHADAVTGLLIERERLFQ